MVLIDQQRRANMYDLPTTSPASSTSRKMMTGGKQGVEDGNLLAGTNGLLPVEIKALESPDQR
jgi:hypothetical protein